MSGSVKSNPGGRLGTDVAVGSAAGIRPLLDANSVSRRLLPIIHCSTAVGKNSDQIREEKLQRVQPPGFPDTSETETSSRVPTGVEETPREPPTATSALAHRG